VLGVHWGSTLYGDSLERQAIFSPLNLTTMTNFNLNVGDTILNSVITNMNEKSCWLDGKRYSWSSINKLLARLNDSKIITRKNLDISIDWTNKEEVIKYYNSFKEWSLIPLKYYFFRGITCTVQK
jgi:hypothetical protein